MHFMEYWDGSLAGAIILSGLVIVFVALIILIGVVQITGRVVNKEAYAPKPPEKPSAPPPPSSAPPAAKGPSTSPAVQQGIAQETVAVISAAVAAVMDEQNPGVAYSIAGIQPQQRSRAQRPVWGFAGMQQNTRPF